MQRWQLQTAKAHLSQLVQDALNSGPQEISLRGEPAVIVLSKKQYDKLIKPQPSFITFMQQSPLSKIKIKITRDKSVTRDVDL